MKCYKSIISITILIVISNSGIKAQLTPVDSLLTRALTTDELLPMLIDSAIKYSPEVRRVNSNIDQATEDVSIKKKQIFNAASFVTSYNYGTNYASVNNSNNINSPNYFSTVQSGFYNIGVVVQLPLTHIISRKNIIKSAESFLNAHIAEKDKAALYTKQEVIRLYQELKLAQRLVMISSKNRQSAMINYNMAEKEFIQGQIKIEELARVMDIYSKASVEYEVYINRFQTNYVQLEAYTGVNLSDLIKQIR